VAAPQGEHKRALSAEGELAEAGPKGPRSEVLAREQALQYQPETAVLIGVTLPTKPCRSTRFRPRSVIAGLVTIFQLV
jgi:hypothetical protein